jgi:hypothetical protein
MPEDVDAIIVAAPIAARRAWRGRKRHPAALAAPRH